MPPPLSRRTFLAAVGATAAGLGSRSAAAGRYRIGLESYCFHDVDLATTLAHTRSLGIDHLELHDGHLPVASTPEALARARSALRTAGITPAGVYMHDAFTASEAVARPIFEYAHAMGFEYIAGGPRPEALPLLNRLVEQHDIAIAIHNHGPGTRYDTLEQVTAVLATHPNLLG